MGVVCDDLGVCYDDSTSGIFGGSDPAGPLPATGGSTTDSGDPCDPSSIAYDPVACANVTGSFTPQGGTSDPGIGYFDPSVIPDEVSWCQANPGSCDANGVTAAYVDQYCADNPANCDTLPDGTVGTTTASGSVRPTGGGIKIPNIPTSTTGGGGSFLGGLTSFLNGLFQTCPAGYISVTGSNGQKQCVHSSTLPASGAATAGLFGNGMIGGVSIGTIALIALVLFLIARKKG